MKLEELKKEKKYRELLEDALALRDALVVLYELLSDQVDHSWWSTDEAQQCRDVLNATMERDWLYDE